MFLKYEKNTKANLFQRTGNTWCFKENSRARRLCDLTSLTVILRNALKGLDVKTQGNFHHHSIGATSEDDVLYMRERDAPQNSCDVENRRFCTEKIFVAQGSIQRNQTKSLSKDEKKTNITPLLIMQSCDDLKKKKQCLKT